MSAMQELAAVRNASRGALRKRYGEKESRMKRGIVGNPTSCVEELNRFNFYI